MFLVNCVRSGLIVLLNHALAHGNKHKMITQSKFDKSIIVLSNGSCNFLIFQGEQRELCCFLGVYIFQIPPS